MHDRPSAVTIRSPVERWPATADDEQFALWCRHLYAAEHSTIHQQHAVKTFAVQSLINHRPWFCTIPLRSINRLLELIHKPEWPLFWGEIKSGTFQGLSSILTTFFQTYSTAVYGTWHSSYYGIKSVSNIDVHYFATLWFMGTNSVTAHQKQCRIIWR